MDIVKELARLTKERADHQRNIDRIDAVIGRVEQAFGVGATIRVAAQTRVRRPQWTGEGSLSESRILSAMRQRTGDVTSAELMFAGGTNTKSLLKSMAERGLLVRRLGVRGATGKAPFLYSLAAKPDIQDPVAEPVREFEAASV